MKTRLIRTVALLLLLTAVIAWAGAGANRGWTKTSVPVKTMDEITGIEAITYEKRFVPGVDFLAGAVVISLGLFGVSMLFQRKGAAEPA
jgi:hypothetical protein